MKNPRLPLVALAVLVAAGCAGRQDFTTAQRLYQLKQYDEAIAQLESAVKSDPGNAVYRQFLGQVKGEAARYEYQRGLVFYEKHQIDQALLAFEKAKTYDPDFEQAKQAFAAVKQRKEIIQTVLSEIPGLIAGGRPDDALDKLSELEPYSLVFPEINDLKAKALDESTILHTKQGSIYLQTGRFDQARKEFVVALDRTPNYRPAQDGLAAAQAQIEAAGLVAEGRELLASGEYSAAYAKFQLALKVVPAHRDALEALIDAGTRWAKSLYDEGCALQAKGDFDSLAEALRRFERAGALTESFPDLNDRVAAVKKVLAGEFLRRAEQYDELGGDYLGLALINYRMSLFCDPAQIAVSRKVSEIKTAFDAKRAFYIDIKSADRSSSGASFDKQLVQQLKEAVMKSGINDFFVLAPYESAGSSGESAAVRSLPGRRMTIFTSLLSEDVVTTGKNKPQLVRSRYKVGTRFVPNPDYMSARQELAAAEAELTDVEHRYTDALDRLRLAEPEDRDALQADADFEKRRFYDAQDKAAELRTKVARTPEQMEDEVFQPYDYRVYTVTMNAKVEVSLEVADPDTFAVKNLEVMSGTASAQSTYNDGVSATDANGVTPQAESLPSESELLSQARVSTAGRAVQWLKKSLGLLSVQYYQRGKDLAEIGDTEQAAEYYYAYYLSTPDKESPEALEAIDYVRRHTHLVTADETESPRKR